MSKPTNIKKTKGFTIVELLVVIVVIGILAAISIVSYSGVSNKAKTAKAQANANSAISVANIYALDEANSGYPSTATILANYSTGSAKLPANLSVNTSINAALNSGNGQNTVLYMPNTSNTGACVAYWNYTGNGVSTLMTGAATTSVMNVTTSTCN